MIIHIKYDSMDQYWRTFSEWVNYRNIRVKSIPVMDGTDFGMHFAYDFKEDADANAFKLKFGEHCL